MNLYSIYRNGAANFIAGNLVESNSKQRTFLNPSADPAFSKVIVPDAAFTPGVSVFWQYVNPFYQVFYNSNIPVGATFDANRIYVELIAAVPQDVSVFRNDALSQFEFTHVRPGAENNFTIQVGATVYSPVAPAVNGPDIKHGRIVVPATNNINVSIPRNSLTPVYRYPVIGDSAQTISKAAIVISAPTTSEVFSPRFNYTSVSAGSTGVLLLDGLIIVQPITSVSSTDALFVETNVVNDTVGRVTSVSTATTLPLGGRFFVEQGCTQPNQNIAVRCSE